MPSQNQFTIQNTLDGFATVFSDVLGPEFKVYTSLPSIPYIGGTPAIIVTEYRQVVARVLAGMRGNPDHLPNLYSFIYLKHQLGQKTVKTLDQIVREGRQDLENIIEAFNERKNQSLRGTVMRAADHLEVHYDRYGPYLKLFDNNFIGAFGLIEVIENYRPAAQG